jgi:hypothetical protein
VTVNSKEENSYSFCLNYVQEFGLCTDMYILYCMNIGQQKLVEGFPSVIKSLKIWRTCAPHPFLSP